ncbi:hypothetical protein BC567DRAFT_48544 [Phyllosticta citribraziliensis]
MEQARRVGVHQLTDNDVKTTGQPINSGAFGSVKEAPFCPLPYTTEPALLSPVESSTSRLQAVTTTQSSCPRTYPPTCQAPHITEVVSQPGSSVTRHLGWPSAFRWLRLL